MVDKYVMEEIIKYMDLMEQIKHSNGLKLENIEQRARQIVKSMSLSSQIIIGVQLNDLHVINNVLVTDIDACTTQDKCVSYENIMKSVINCDDTVLFEAFTTACERGHSGIVKLLSKRLGNTVRVIEKGLLIACNSKQLEVVSMLLELRNIFRYNNHILQGCLFNACSNNNLEVVTMLLNAECCTDQDELDESYRVACEKNFIEVVKILSVHPISVRHRIIHPDIEIGVTVACENRHYKILKLLLDYGAKDIRNGLMSTVNRRDSETFKMLLQSGVVVENTLETIFFDACIDNLVEDVKFLLDNYDYECSLISQTYAIVCNSDVGKVLKEKCKL